MLNLTDDTRADLEIQMPFSCRIRVTVCLIYASSFLVFLLMLNGCLSQRNGAQEKSEKEKLISDEIRAKRDPAGRPAIHNLGTNATIVFEKGKILEIPIDGQDLLNPNYDINIGIEATEPLLFGTDYCLASSITGARRLVQVNADATKLFESGDHLILNVTITKHHDELSRFDAASELVKVVRPQLTDAQRTLIASGTIDLSTAATLGELASVADLKGDDLNSYKALFSAQDSSDGKKLSDAFDRGFALAKTAKGIGLTEVINKDNKPVARDVEVASESREFVLYTPQTYRSNVLSHEIELQNITAFPLPEEETARLFGPYVAQYFFALRLTINNPTDKDQLVSLGMIKAYGRALVTTAKEVGPPFTKSIEVAPQSQQHVFTMIQNQKIDTAREWVFRSLDFAGALATVMTPNLVTPGRREFATGVAVATGTAIPGLKTLFPDRVPQYLVDIVNFGMQDLVKVPKGGSVDGKYLFFSKNELQAVLQDPLLRYQHLHSDDWLPYFTSDLKFSANVVYLSFDTLQIPYENTAGSPPAPPSGVTAKGNESSVVIGWSPYDKAVSYSVLGSDVKGGPYSSFGTSNLIPSQTTSFTDTPLNPGVTRYYVVRVTTGDGMSGNSTEVHATTTTLQVSATKSENDSTEDKIDGTKKVAVPDLQAKNTESGVTSGNETATPVEQSPTKPASVEPTSSSKEPKKGTIPPTTPILTPTPTKTS